MCYIVETTNRVGEMTESTRFEDYNSAYAAWCSLLVTAPHVVTVVRLYDCNSQILNLFKAYLHYDAEGRRVITIL